MIRESAVEVLRYIRAQNRVKRTVDGVALEHSLEAMLSTLPSDEPSDEIRPGDCVVLKNGRIAKVWATRQNFLDGTSILATITECVRLWPAQTTDVVMTLHSDGRHPVDDDFSASPNNTSA